MRTPSSRFRRHATRGALVAATVLLAQLSPRAASAQTAAAQFERVQAQEQQLGDAAPPEALRRAAKDYEAIVLHFPTSAYCDNALWQAGQLVERAWQRSADIKDRDEAVRVFSWLAKEYPGSLARQATSRVTALKAAPAPAAPAVTPAATAVPSQGNAPTNDQSPAALATPAPSAPPVAGTQATTSQARAGAPVVVRGISRTPLPKGDRITIELSAEATYTGERVSNPDRVYLDFPNATLAASVADDVRRLNSPLVKTVRVGSPTKGVSRVVLELTGAPRYSAFFLYSPFRLVVDVETETALPLASPPPASRPLAPAQPNPQSATPASTPTPTPSPTPAFTAPAPPAASAPPSSTSAGNQNSQATATNGSDSSASPVAPSSTGRGDYSLTRQLGLRVAKIVIDPGHGGHDPGAISNGVTESEVVLDIALRLQKLLEQSPGVEVVLTRNTNEFIPLEERTAIAKREHADLFLSIHANSHHTAAVSGIETYFLNFATTPDAEAVAARENAASVQTLGTLPAIVKAIYLNDKVEESREFATLLQSSLTRRARSQSSVTRDLGVKQAPFVVLIGAQMPSVLTEIGFLTNKTDAGLLKQAAYRQLLAQALRDAVVKYQDSLKRVGSGTSQPRRQ